MRHARPAAIPAPRRIASAGGTFRPTGGFKTPIWDRVAAVTVGAATEDVDRNPYVGVRPFRSDETALFFGRVTEIRALVERWTADPVTVLHGPAGVGKTSLLEAGVPAGLRWPLPDVLPVGRLTRAVAFPVAALPEHNPYTLALLSSWSPAEPPSRLAGITIGDFLRRRGGRTDHYGDPVPVLAAIDQAETLFEGPPARDGERAAFLDELSDACAELPGLRLLLSVRDERLADYIRHFGSAARHALRPFTRDEAREAVAGPMERAGRWFAPGAVEALLDALGAGAAGGSIEPVVVQVVCSRLWRSLPPAVRAITTEHVHEFADAGRALAAFCGKAIAAVAAEYGLPASRLASWLQHAFVTEDGRRSTVREDGGQVAGLPEPVARALEDRHVLKAEAAPRRYTLQHDHLAGPLLRVQPTDLRPDDTPAAFPDRLRAAAATLADGEPARAEEQVDRALRHRHGDDLRERADAELVRGDIAHARGEPAAAERHYRAAAAMYATLQDTVAVTRLLMAVGRSLLAQGRTAEAVAELRAAAERAPDDPAVQTELGRTLWQAGQENAALTVLTGVLAANGDTPEALLTRGEMLADLGKAEDALRDLDRVPRHRRPATRAARALALATLRDIRAAGQEIDTVLADAPDNGPVLLYAARIGALGGDRSRASEFARRATAARAPALSPHQREEALRLMQAGPDDPPR